MRDRTGQTEPLTTGQRIVARWESPGGGMGEPADLAEEIDKAIAAACAEAVRLHEQRKAASVDEPATPLAMAPADYYDAEALFWDMYNADKAGDMSPEDWGNWVSNLPRQAFLTMLAIGLRPDGGETAA